MGFEIIHPSDQFLQGGHKQWDEPCLVKLLV
jgi:hypothetical protein